ncbi:hypothetical protein [Flavobacterium coralii]|uniref:hypothetical protein n=1 Tax=Flavobacterium coralii TaxID=2838017 RepID=UPI000C635261|nr:hypothetical protein [Flavobacterium sp.]|tara:strand:- start:4151 stop:4579 length:429 start_codon:yes stop_codon:yes gene_type:complete
MKKLQLKIFLSLIAVLLGSVGNLYAYAGKEFSLDTSLKLLQLHAYGEDFCIEGEAESIHYKESLTAAEGHHDKITPSDTEIEEDRAESFTKTPDALTYFTFAFHDEISPGYFYRCIKSYTCSHYFNYFPVLERHIVFRVFRI